MGNKEWFDEIRKDILKYCKYDEDAIANAEAWASYIVQLQKENAELLNILHVNWENEHVVPFLKEWREKTNSNELTYPSYFEVYKAYNELRKRLPKDDEVVVNRAAVDNYLRYALCVCQDCKEAKDCSDSPPKNRCEVCEAEFMLRAAIDDFYDYEAEKAREGK